MNCPKCHAPLVQKRFKGRDSDVDYCGKCQGIWFDDGELSSVIGVAARKLSPPATARPSAIACPRCEKPLAIFSYPGTMTVIDGCRTCRGVWLDSGEFQELAKVKRDPERPAPQPRVAPVAPPEISGVKGQMIRFIDSSLQSLWSGIRS